MATIKSFKGIRPKNQKIAEKMISLPYDVMNRKEAKKMAMNKSYSFLKIVRSEIELNDSIDSYSDKVYLKAKENLYKWIEEKILISDKTSCFYIYKQEMNKRFQIGLVSCVSVDDYINNVIKKHELTREKKELDRIKHFDMCDANTEPVFLTYKQNNNIDIIINKWINNNKPVYDITTEDDIRHSVWVLNNKKYINSLIAIFKNIEYLYIADGHHRSASAVKTALKRRNENVNYDGTEEFNNFLAVIFPDKDLYIMDYNRVVKDLNNLTTEEFLNKIKKTFFIKKSLISSFKPTKKGEIGMFLNNTWYVINPKQGTYNQDDPVESLDAAILQNNLLAPILNIKDPKINNRIDFIGGIRGIQELEKRVKTDMKIAFSLYPVTIKDIMKVSDANKIMPPKSTWFEPKLRSGLFIHKLK